MRHGAQFPAVALNEDRPQIKGASYLHFGVIVGGRGCQLLAEDQIGIPFGSPMLDAPTLRDGERFRIAARVHRVELGDDLDVLIVATEQPGRLRTNAHFTMPDLASGTAPADPTTSA